jgi:hypothetical protein
VTANKINNGFLKNMNSRWRKESDQKFMGEKVKQTKPDTEAVKKAALM